MTATDLQPDISARHPRPPSAGYEGATAADPHDGIIDVCTVFVGGEVPWADEWLANCRT